ncbi:MAG: GacS/BarA family sensor protein [Francisellaceae bacterium]|nr:GacS/BarA family sensor protein [Francisellaceae bacterium]
MLYQNTRVLLVEDQEISRKVINLILSDMSCVTTSACSGQEALELFWQNDYDIILLDIGLPDFNGLEVAKIIRSSNNPKAQIPIAIISAYSSEKYTVEATDLGLNDFMVKPVIKEECERLIMKYFPSHTSYSC